MDEEKQNNATNEESLDQMDDEWAAAMAESQEADAQNESGDGPAESAEPEIKKAQFEDFREAQPSRPPERKMDMILDVVLPVSIELGRTEMFIKKILELERGSVIELDKMAGEPVDLYINNKKMAEGEVVVVDKHFGVRITNLIDPADRIKNLSN